MSLDLDAILKRADWPHLIGPVLALADDVQALVKENIDLRRHLQAIVNESMRALGQMSRSTDAAQILIDAVAHAKEVLGD